MRALLGIAELHSMIASPMQAARCSAVGRISADGLISEFPVILADALERILFTDKVGMPPEAEASAEIG